jgi:hypothetical protein
MKKKILIPTLFLFSFLFVTTIYLASCNKNTSSTKTVDTTQKFSLNEKGLLDDNIFLPAGTSWQYVSSSGSEVRLTLPEGYGFLKSNLSDGSYVIDPGGGGYSCTCSKGGSCKVFYQKELGYGCLQNDCSGSCTGSPTANQQKILGVVNLENDHLDLTSGTIKASLSEEGKRAFFKLPQVQAEIKKNYDFVYANIAKPNFQEIDPNNLPKNYFIGKFFLYGVEVGLLLPKDEGLLNARPELRASLVAPTSCKCSGTSGGDNCKLHKDCILGYCAYSCSGCTTCTMN